MRRVAILVLTVLAALPAGARAAAPQATGRTRAGAAVVDASWHLGASQGQYADPREIPGDDVPVDPYAHSGWKMSSYGLGSRITTRALVVEDTAGDRVAIVTHDLYLPQDLLTRRVGSLLAEHDRLVSLGLADGPITGITGENLAVTASHSHSSPYYSTPSWGVWLFQDVFDVRFFDYMASRMAQAVIDASARLVPVRMGGATTSFNEITSHSYGPQVGDDGTPAGQPWWFTTGRLTVVRFDDVSEPAAPRPLATWFVHGVHPEWVFGDGLVNGDITQAAYHLLDREIGGVTLWSQRETGTAGPHKDLRVHPPEARREFQDMKFSALDRAARLVADAVGATHGAIAAWSAGDGDPEFPELFAPLATDFDVASVSARFAPPATRPYPGISNCNTRKAFEGNPGVPIAGLPDCEFPLEDFTEPVLAAAPVDLAALHDQLVEAGVPIPTSYSPTSFTGVEETVAVHLQAMRLGEIAITFSPAEQFTDTALNIESRLDAVEDNVWTGWDWSSVQPCSQQPDTRWVCPNPRNPSQMLPPVPDLAYRRMRAQIHNDAAGWEDPAYAPYAESEPTDPALIKGNFTHAEAPRAYALPISVGMANDYWGYIPTYREYRAHDHYRKALAGLGPHGAEFMATRLVTMAASLKGTEPVAQSPLDLAYQAEGARAAALADALGAIARAYEDAYSATLPPDGGEPAITQQPDDVHRFDAATVRWIGGSTYDDLPDARVERLVDGEWVRYGDTGGDVQLMAAFPLPGDLPSWRSGAFEWRWTASFEAFVSDVPGLTTPTGTYRFVIDGARRTPSGIEPYHLASTPFDVAPWGGITVEGITAEPDGDVTFGVGPSRAYTFGADTYAIDAIAYPDSYASPFPFIRNEPRLFTYGLQDRARHQIYCPRCSFRAWADRADVASASVTVARADGGTDVVAATWDGTAWRAATALQPGDVAYVEAGGITDTYGESNDSRSEEVTA